MSNTEVDYVRVSQAMERAFSQVPFSNFLYRIKNKLSSDTKLTYEEHYKGNWEPRFKDLKESGAILAQDKNYAGVAAWFPPGTSKSPRNENEAPIFLQLDAKVKQAHSKIGLKPGNFWLLQFLARDPERTSDSKGAISGVVKPFLAKADEDNLPAVLEAVTEHGISVYKHFGFEVAETFDLVDEISGEKHPVFVMVYGIDRI